MAKDREVQVEQEAVQHTLPGWVLWVQEHLMLSFLIIAEAYILGTLMTSGWVRSVEDPQTWGWFNGIGVVLFFAAGITAAGVALRCSVTAASAFARRAWGLGLFNCIGLLVFSGAEIWASLSERSANLQPTPADSAVLKLMGMSSLAVSPTILIIALLLPFSTFFWGFSQTQQVPKETSEKRAMRQQKEEEELAHKLKMQAMRASGLATTFRAASNALVAKKTEATTSGDVDQLGTIDMPDLPGEVSEETSAITSGKSTASARVTSGQNGSMVTRIAPRGLWTKHDLREYVMNQYDTEMSEQEAQNAIANLPDVERLDGVRGNPYAAPKSSAKRWADKRFSQPEKSSAVNE